jgi:hypothetical protein
VVRNEFDVDTFDENVDIEQHIEENDETEISVSDKENMQPSVDTGPDAPVSTGGEGNEANALPPHWLLCVMSQHQVTLTGVYITQAKS